MRHRLPGIKRSMALTPREVAEAKSYLLDGYGAEDIAIKLRTPPRRVREQIAKWRASGYLDKWFGRKA